MKDEEQGERSIGCLLIPVHSIEDFRLVNWDGAGVRDIADSLSQVDQTGNHCPCRVDDKTIEYDPAMKKVYYFCQGELEGGRSFKHLMIRATY